MDICAVRATATRWAGDEPLPGTVEVQFTELDGTVVTLIDKAPVFAEALDTNSDYPVDVLLAAEVLAVSTPGYFVRLLHGLEDSYGRSEFTVGWQLIQKGAGQNLMNRDLATALDLGDDQPERFLSAWYGPPDGDPHPPRDASGMPAAVSRWLQAADRWSATHSRQNEIPTLAEWDGDVMVIGVENQGVWLWGIESGGATGVLERENETGRPWTPTGESLTEYLWHFLLFEAVLMGRHMLAINDATKEQRDRFLADWTRLPIKPWRWPGPEHALWYRDESLAVSFAEEPPGGEVGPDTCHAIYVASRTDAALARIDRGDIPWDFDSADS